MSEPPDFGATAYGTSQTLGETHILRFELHYPHPLEQVWAAIATPEGLPTWLASAHTLEPRVGGAVMLRWLNTDEHGNSTVAAGTVTAWAPPRLAEFSLDVHGRVLFQLEPDPILLGTLVRFTNEITGPDEERVSRLAGWHQHFEYLDEALAGHPVDWTTWTPQRWRELYAEYSRSP
jgi:uncharacterized protein YndB with AHSA1/START domain